MSALINDPILAEIWKDVEHEIERANFVHPNYPSDPVRRTAIVCEEAGEAIQAALDLTRGKDHLHHDLGGAKVRLVNELTQTAAACINQLRVMRGE